MTDRTTFAPFVSLRQAMDELVNESFTGTPYRTLWSRGLSNGATVSPLPLDVLAAAPGLQPDQFQITYNQGTLQLSGTINNVANSGEAKDATWYVHELWSGQFQRAVSLPVEVDVDHAEASFEYGIVKVVLPKAEQAKPKSIPITTNGQQAISSGT